MGNFEVLYGYDVETGLYWCATRFFDPEIGRWISPDSLEYLDPNSINGLNLYAYCENNPVKGYDPMGTWNWGTFWKVVSGIATVGIIAVAFVSNPGLEAMALTGAIAGATIGGVGAAVTGGDILSGILGGALIGAASGFALGTGMLSGTATAAKLTTLTATGIGSHLSLGAASAIASLTVGLAYAGNYMTDITSNNKDFNAGALIANFVLGAYLGNASVGVGYMFGNIGLGFKLKGLDLFARVVGTSILQNITIGVAGFAGRYIINTIANGY